MLHYRGKDVATAGKVLVISELLSKINYVEVKDFLLALFPDSNQFFLLPSTESRDLPLSAMSVEQIEAVIFKKESNENRIIVAGDFKLEFNSLKAIVNSVEDEEQTPAQLKLKEFVRLQTIEAIASNALKRFGMYTDPVSKRPLLLLDNRIVFTTDKARVKAAAHRLGVAYPKCKAVLEISPTGRVRRHIEEPIDSDDDFSTLFTKRPPPHSDSEN